MDDRGIDKIRQISEIWDSQTQFQKPKALILYRERKFLLTVDDTRSVFTFTSQPRKEEDKIGTTHMAVRSKCKIIDIGGVPVYTILDTTGFCLIPVSCPQTVTPVTEFIGEKIVPIYWDSTDAPQLREGMLPTRPPPSAILDNAATMFGAEPGVSKKPVLKKKIPAITAPVLTSNLVQTRRLIRK